MLARRPNDAKQISKPTMTNFEIDQQKHISMQF